MPSSGSPVSRRIEWTGERCVPWSDDIQVIYEHYQRYLFVAPLAKGRRVLDLACGEGYGTAILAAQAQSVLGIDIDHDSVQHATDTYNLPNVRFAEGDMLDLSALEDGEFDLVVCFEALEHVDDHEQLLNEVTRVLSSTGIFVVSTPDRLTYTEDLGQVNPFHVHELSRVEFEELISARFDHLKIWGQNISVGSMMMPLDPNDGSTDIIVLSHDEDHWTAGARLNPTYFVAVASNAPLGEMPSYSSLIDPDIELVRNAMRQRDDARNDARQAEAESHQRRQQAQLLTDRLEATHAELLQAHHKVEILEEHARHLELHRVHFKGEFEALKASRAYRMGNAMSNSAEKIVPLGSARRRHLGQLKRRGQAFLGHPIPQAPTTTTALDPPPSVPKAADPRVTVVIPVHNGWELTAKCLWSLVEDSTTVPYEVIVVDDGSTDETSQRLTQIDGVQVVHLERNQGFLAAVNAGAASGMAEYLVLLNNDVEVQSGWLDALVTTADTDEQIGLLGARLLFPNGTLQEAGGIIWSDGAGWNYGRYQYAESPLFSFRRDVDYCSGACLLVRRELWDKLGGFDTRFAPAYYEDADLAFGARSLGYRVVYEPNCTVIHDEGGSYGTDESPKKSALMEENRKTFTSKWAHELPQQFPHDDKLVRVASWRRPAGRVLVVDHMTPTFDQDAGSLRMFELLRMLTAMNFAVTFVPLNRANEAKYTQAVQRLGVEVLHGSIDLTATITEMASDLRLAILSRPQVAWGVYPILRELAPDAKIIYDTVDLHFLREARRAEIEDTLDAARSATRHYEMEVWLAQASDAVFVVSESEREMLATEAPDASIFVIPTIHEGDNPGLPYPERQGLLFVGSFNHPPNRDAVEWLTREVLPIVHRDLPELPVYIVGSNPTSHVEALAGTGVEILGWVPDLDPLYARTRLFVAPLRYGAGIRGKIGESAANGLPVVSTSLGAEGLRLKPGDEILVADGAELFAAAIIRGYRDPVLWQKLATGARRAIALQCSPSIVREQLLRALDALEIDVVPNAGHTEVITTELTSPETAASSPRLGVAP